MIKRKIVWLLFLFVWSSLIQAVHLLLKIFSLLGNTRSKDWTEPRKQYSKILKKLKDISSSERPIVLGVASSAGEYEQLLPVLERIRAEGWLPIILFFSSSGMRYANSRKEEIIWFPTPLDSYFHVRKFFKSLRPKLVIVARHEIWPNFLFHAAKESRLVLIDASVSNGMKKDFLGLRRRMFSLFHSIHAVSREDYEWFKLNCQQSVNIHESGDTKYDRAIERLQQTKTTREKLVVEWLSKYGNQKFLLIGSAWPEDLEFVLNSIGKTRLSGVKIVVVPHQTNLQMITIMQEKIRKYSYEPCLYSDPSKSEGVILVDQLGILFDLYDIAAWVWVGGGIHHQVHNVLEPAVRGIPIGFGPKFQNSHEATDLVARELVLATDKPEEFSQWLKTTPPNEHLKLKAYMRKKIGASEQILHHTKIDQLKAEKRYDRTKNNHQLNTM